ncbi:MAG: hypothetical protein WD512_14190 [Candidatus Paceibacterota bacterium]
MEKLLEAVSILGVKSLKFRHQEANTHIFVDIGIEEFMLTYDPLEGLFYRGHQKKKVESTKELVEYILESFRDLVREKQCTADSYKKAFSNIEESYKKHKKEEATGKKSRFEERLKEM